MLSTGKVVTLQNGVALPFYTYEKLNTTTSPLSIYVTGDLQKIQVTTTFNEDMTIQNVTKGDIIEEEKTVHINMRILIRQKSLKDVRQMVSYMVIDMSLQVKYP